MSTSVIVVLRHACDNGNSPVGQTIPFNKNITFNNHGSHTKIDADNNVLIPVNRLGELGVKQAAGLAGVLQILLKDYCPVSRIVTEDTGSNHDDGTPNPLRTIYPYANSITQNVSFDIYNGGEAADPKIFNVPSLLQDGIGTFSTVICWEAKGMWRHESGVYQKDSILGVLSHCGPNGEKIANYEQMKLNQPYKGQIIYIFECSNADHSLSLKMFSYDITQPDGKQITPITSTSKWPSNLCLKPKKS